MTNPVAPVEGPLYLLFTEYENTTNIRRWSKEPFYGAQEYVPVSELERLREALNQIENMEYINQLSGNMNFERAQKIARAALEGGTV